MMRELTYSIAFQFTPLREGRLSGCVALDKAELFQFTPLREGRLERRRFSHLRAQGFNSRPCVRGDGSRKSGVCSSLQFQFTPMREGRRS